MHDEINPKNKDILNKFDKELSLRTLTISNEPAPNSIGIAIKKEYFADFSFSIPIIIPMDIVIPEREIPGNNAKTWIKPIHIAEFNIIFLFALSWKKYVKHNKNPVIKNVYFSIEVLKYDSS